MCQMNYCYNCRHYGNQLAQWGQHSPNAVCLLAEAAIDISPVDGHKVLKDESDLSHGFVGAYKSWYRRCADVRVVDVPCGKFEAKFVPTVETKQRERRWQRFLGTARLRDER